MKLAKYQSDIWNRLVDKIWDACAPGMTDEDIGSATLEDMDPDAYSFLAYGREKIQKFIVTRSKGLRKGNCLTDSTIDEYIIKPLWQKLCEARQVFHNDWILEVKGAAK